MRQYWPGIVEGMEVSGEAGSEGSEEDDDDVEIEET
jgi:hypothetical protein